MTDETTKTRKIKAESAEEWLYLAAFLTSGAAAWVVWVTYKPLTLALVATFPSLSWLIPGQ